MVIKQLDFCQSNLIWLSNSKTSGGYSEQFTECGNIMSGKKMADNFPRFLILIRIIVIKSLIFRSFYKKNKEL